LGSEWANAAAEEERMNKIQISQLNAARSTGVVIERHKDSLPEAAQEAHAEAIELIEKIVETGQQ